MMKESSFSFPYTVFKLSPTTICTNRIIYSGGWFTSDISFMISFLYVYLREGHNEYINSVCVCVCVCVSEEHVMLISFK